MATNGRKVKIEEFLVVAVEAIKGTLEMTERGASVRIPLGEDDSLNESLPRGALSDTHLTMTVAPLTSTLHSAVQSTHGKVFAGGVAERHLPQLPVPVPFPFLLFWYRLELLSPRPQDHCFGIVVGVDEERPPVSVDSSFLQALFPHIEPQNARFRIESELFQSRSRLARVAASAQGEELAAVHRDELLQWRSRKRREIDQIFDDRLFEAEKGGVDSGPESPEELRRDWNQALERVERYYDPASLGVLLGVEFVALITRPARRRRRGSQSAEATGEETP